MKKYADDVLPLPSDAPLQIYCLCSYYVFQSLLSAFPPIVITCQASLPVRYIVKYLYLSLIHSTVSMLLFVAQRRVAGVRAASEASDWWRAAGVLRLAGDGHLGPRCTLPAPLSLPSKYIHNTFLIINK